MAPRSSSPAPILCAVLDAAALGPNPKDAARGLFRNGVDWIQLRDRSLEAGALLLLVRELTRARDLETATSANPCRVVVNRRIDVALAAGADGVHLGFDALDPTTTACLLPENALIGVSLHSVQEVESFAVSTLGKTRLQHLLYAHLAPIWDPLSKPASRPALGADLLSRACVLGPRILAQGGLDPVRAVHAIQAGAAGIAVTGILGNPTNAIRAVRRLRGALDGQMQPER